jgi:hypothetical protein
VVIHDDDAAAAGCALPLKPRVRRYGGGAQKQSLGAPLLQL